MRVLMLEEAKLALELIGKPSKGITSFVDVEIGVGGIA